MIRKILFISLLALAVNSLGTLSAQEKQFTLSSPNGKLVSHIVATEKEELTYDIVFNGITIMLPSHVGLNRSYGKTVTGSMAVEKTSTRSIDQTIASPFTRQATMRDRCNELTLQLKNNLFVDFRAYDEGIAYRFRTGKECVVRFEKVEYNFASDYKATVPYVQNFDPNNFDAQFFSSFENTYTTLPLSQLDTRRLAFLPLMVHASGGVKVCIGESHLEHFPGLYLKGMGHKGRLEGDHARYPRLERQGGHNNLQMIVEEREEYIARLSKGDEMPWRIAMIGRTAADIAMNNMTYLLASPCRLQQTDWIRPGKVAWDWWNCWNIYGVDFEAGVNNETYKYYIDFAELYGIEYVILDEGWAVNKQADLFQVVPEIDLPMLARYAEQHHVGLILWAGYRAFDRDMENVCRHYSQMGIKGFKIDFMDRDDQEVTEFYYRAAAMCAKYHLLVDFHGAFKPAGLNRTYPNVLNFEGVSGLEQLKWASSDRDQVQYDVELPFIRQTSGPMDYTQGAMLNAAKNCYFPSWTEPMSQGTRCHQLGLYVVLESPLNMLCDAPSNYAREPDYTIFVSAIPTVWDETVVLQGEVGEYIVVARRSGNTWYIGGITNWTPRDIDIDLSALGLDGFKATLYRDGANAHRKGIDYSVDRIDKAPQHLKVHLAPGGGFVAKISK